MTPIPEPNDLRNYALACIRKRYVDVEALRSMKEADDAPCFFGHEGSWDTGYYAFSRRVAAGVLKVAGNQRELDAAIDRIFHCVKIVPGKSGGDHHSGYYQDYNVSTEEALRKAEDTEFLKSQLQPQPC